MFTDVAAEHLAIVDTLLAGLLDDASMYPPSAAPMEAALALHAVMGRSAWSDALGSFLCPAAAIGQLTTERALLGLDGPLAIGVVVGSPADPLGAHTGDLSAALARLANRDPDIEVAGIEAKPSSPDSTQFTGTIAHARQLADEAGATQVAIEVVIRDVDPDVVVDQAQALAEAHRTDARVIGKVRCGSMEPTAVPTSDELALFVSTCAHLRLPFKATAGLHHAVSGSTDQGTHHGYLNLLVAAHAATQSPVAEVARILESTDVAVNPSGLRVADQPMSIAAMAQVRSDGMRSFGTCSLTEPISGLLQLLGADHA